MKHWLLCLLLAGCRLYDPQPIDCRVLCGANGECPDEMFCREGFCRVNRATTRCECRGEEQRACGTSEGACREGVQHCQGTLWGPCENALGPRPELCNGLDDDCDGFIDEEIPLPPACPRTLGVCVNSRQQCLEGEWRACDDTAYGPFFEPVETRCDGRDNDCDGLIDSRPIVELEGHSGDWSLHTTPTGFALISEAQAVWLSRGLEIEASRPRPAGRFQATSRGDTLIVATQTDGGVWFTSLDRDRLAEQLVPGWLNPTALTLSVDVAAAIVNGQVELISLTDGGAPVLLGADLDGTLSLSQTGETLAWSGGLIRTSDLGALRSGSVGPLLALLDLDLTLVAGVPAAQPGAPMFLPDVLAGRPAQPLFNLSVPQLIEIEATEHQGRVLLIGVESPTRALWVVTERGTLRGQVGLRHVRPKTTSSREEMAVFAWEEGANLSLVRRCAP